MIITCIHEFRSDTGIYKPARERPRPSTASRGPITIMFVALTLGPESDKPSATVNY